MKKILLFCLLLASATSFANVIFDSGDTISKSQFCGSDDHCQIEYANSIARKLENQGYGEVRCKRKDFVGFSFRVVCTGMKLNDPSERACSILEGKIEKSDNTDTIKTLSELMLELGC